MLKRKGLIGNANGQIILYDCMFAIFVFVLVFAALNAMHEQNFQVGEEIGRLNEIKHLAHSAIGALTTFEGQPADWNRDSVQLLGLAERNSGTLSQGKVASLSAMQYDDIRSRLLLGGYNFLLEIDSENNAYDQNIGRTIGSEATIIKLERSVLYRGAMAHVRLSVYE